MQLLINIDVDDLDRAIAFYQRALGLHCARRLFDGTVAEMLGGSSPICLMLKPQGSPASTHSALLRNYERHWTPVHLDFVVDDIATTVQTALAAGAKEEGGIRAYDWGRLATMSDPFGHGFCLLQFAGDGYGEVA